MKTLALLLALVLGADQLEFQVTFSLQKTTTEKAIKVLSRESGAKIVMNTNEMSKLGITKNQSFGMEVKKMTARKALLKILDSADPKGRLTYYINEEGTVIVTTIHDRNSNGQADSGRSCVVRCGAGSRLCASGSRLSGPASRLCPSGSRLCAAASRLSAA